MANTRHKPDPAVGYLIRLAAVVLGWVVFSVTFTVLVDPYRMYGTPGVRAGPSSNHVSINRAILPKQDNSSELNQKRCCSGILA